MVIQAKRVTEDIKKHIHMHGTSVVMEPFLASPPSYKEVYKFNAVHSICTRAADTGSEEYEYHQVSVMEMPSAIGDGDTLEEALAAASEMLACAIDHMQIHSETIPLPDSIDQVRIKGGAAAATPHPWLSETTRFVDVLTLKPADLRKIAEKTVEELEALEVEGHRIWDEVCKEAPP